MSTIIDLINESSADPKDVSPKAAHNKKFNVILEARNTVAKAAANMVPNSPYINREATFNKVSLPILNTGISNISSIIPRISSSIGKPTEISIQKYPNLATLFSNLNIKSSSPSISLSPTGQVAYDEMGAEFSGITKEEFFKLRQIARVEELKLKQFTGSSPLNVSDPEIMASIVLSVSNSKKTTTI